MSQFLKKGSLIALFFLFCPLVTKAADSCVANICLNTRVIDDYNRIGTVTAINGDQVRYSVSGSNITNDASNLSPEVSSRGGVQKGAYVIDDYNRIGPAMAVFADGRVQFSVSGNTIVSSNISPEVQRLNDGTAVQTIVIDDYNRVGPALHVFADGRVQFSVSGSSIVSSNISPEVKRLNGTEANTVVIDDYNRVGPALHVFADGRVQFSVGGSLIISSNTVPAVNSANGIAVNTIVIDDYNRVGRASNVFQDGRVQFVVSGSSIISSEVVPEVSALGNIKVGVLVIDDYNRMGTTVHPFKDGRVQFSVGGSQIISSEVSAETARVGKDQDVYKGVVVLDDYNRAGTVAHVFEDQRVNYLVGGTSVINSERNVSPEVLSSPSYQKNQYYASTSYLVGKANRFFKDGRVELVSDWGTTGFSSQLFPQVSAINGYAPGVTVVGADETSGIVTMTFSNGAVEYSFSSPQDKQVHLTSGGIIGFSSNGAIDSKLLKQEQEQWIAYLANAISFGALGNGRTTFVINQAEYNGLKTQLLALLQQEPDLVWDKTLRAKVVAELSK